MADPRVYTTKEGTKILSEEGLRHWEAQAKDPLAASTGSVFINRVDLMMILSTIRYLRS